MLQTRQNKVTQHHTEYNAPKYMEQLEKQTENRAREWDKEEKGTNTVSTHVNFQSRLDWLTCNIDTRVSMK